MLGIDGIHERNPHDSGPNPPSQRGRAGWQKLKGATVLLVLAEDRVPPRGPENHRWIQRRHLDLAPAVWGPVGEEPQVHVEGGAAQVHLFQEENKPEFPERGAEARAVPGRLTKTCPPPSACCRDRGSSLPYQHEKAG